MRLSFVSVLAACGTLLMACSTDPSPTSPPEARFIINGATGTTFEVVEILTANGRHTPSGTFFTPYNFYMLNADKQLQGAFLAVGNQPLSDIELILGGELVPRRVTDPSENPPTCDLSPEDADALCVNTGDMPTPPAQAHEVRFDVASICIGGTNNGLECHSDMDCPGSGCPGVSFGATVGDLSGSHITTPAFVPATFYLEKPVEQVTGVFTKQFSTRGLVVHLLVDGVEVDAAASPVNSTQDAVVTFQF